MSALWALAVSGLVGLVGCQGHSDNGGSSGGAGGSAAQAGASGASGEAGLPSVPTGSCTDFTPCGGDPEGVWSIREACVERPSSTIAPIVDACPESAAASMTLEATGSYRFDQGLLTVELGVTTTVHVAFTADCAESLGATLSGFCAEYGASQAEDPQFSSTACAIADEACRCALVSRPQTREVVNDFDVRGTQFVDSSLAATDFCVEGDVLSTRSTDNGDVLTIVLERQ